MQMPLALTRNDATRSDSARWGAAQTGNGARRFFASASQTRGAGR